MATQQNKTSTTSSTTPKPSPRFPLARIVDEQSTSIGHVLCVVCIGLADKPIQLGCSAHLVCNSCSTYLCPNPAQKVRCPKCPAKEPFFLGDKAPMDLITNMILDRNVRCVFDNCKHTTTVRKIDEHERECPFRTVFCSNDGCPHGSGTGICHQNLAEHQKTCGFNLIDCPNACGQKIRFQDLDNHLTKACTNAIVYCPHECGAKFQANALQAHLSGACPNQVISCSVLGCEFSAPRGADQTWAQHHQTGAGKHVEKLQSLVLSMLDRITLLERSAFEQQQQPQRQPPPQQWGNWQQPAQQQPFVPLTFATKTVRPGNNIIIQPFDVSWGSSFASPILSFYNHPNPALRYSFQLFVDMDCNNSKGSAGVFFSPRFLNTVGLTLPIRNHIELGLGNPTANENEFEVLMSATLTRQDDREYFRTANPSQVQGRCGWPNFASQNLVMLSDSRLVVWARLLDAQFDA